MGASPVDHHDGIFLREWRCIVPIWLFIEPHTQCEGPQGHEASHHVIVLEFVLDRVCVVWTGLLKKPREVIHRRPCRTLLTVCIGRDASHTGADLPVAAIIVDGRGPLKALPMPLATAFDALLCAVSGDVEQRLLVATRGHLPTSLCRAKHDHLVIGGTLGGDVAWRLECALEGVTTSTLPLVLRVALD
jgi:hypothetical protein